MSEITILSQQEKESFHFHRRRVSDNILGAQKLLWDAAESLKYIRDNRLYREEYNTFEAFCLAEYNIQRAYAYRIINAETVIQNIRMSPMGDKVITITERQARPLTKLQPELQREAWKEVVETNAQEKITAKKVQEVARQYEPLNEEIKERSKPSTVFEQRQPMSEKEIMEKAKAVKEKRREEFLVKKQERIEKKAESPIPTDQQEIINRCKKGETVIINMNTQFHVLKWAEDNSKMQRVDRYSEFGNPFYLDTDGDRDHVCDAYQRYFKDKKSIHEKAKNLKGKVLACHCYPKRCHAQTLKDYADKH